MNPLTPVPRDENGNKRLRIYSIAYEQREMLYERDHEGHFKYEIDWETKPPQDAALVDIFDDPRRQALCYVYSHPTFDITPEGACLVEYHVYLRPCDV